MDRADHQQQIATAGWTTASLVGASPRLSVRPQSHAPSVADASGYLSDTGGARYRIGGIIGVGGMGVVMAAEQSALHRQVAIKRCTASDHDTRARFQAEARCLAALDHPHVVPIYDAGDNYFVMRRIAGRSLMALIECKDLATTTLVEILLKVCDAVAMAHSRGIMHRDLKSENVMVGDHGEVFVVDWGLALSFAADEHGEWLAPPLRSADLGAGTPGCLPPELALGDRSRVGQASDVFQLGAMLWHGLVGRLPYDLPDAFAALCAAADGQRQPLTTAAPMSPPRLRRVVDRAMDFDPSRRGTVTELAESLRQWLRNSAAEEQAMQSCANGLAMLNDTPSTTDDYARLGQALMLIDQACALDSRHEYLEARQRAMKAFAHCAIRHGDIHLARALMAGRLPIAAIAALGSPR